MAKPNYSFEKRQRELEKKKKKEEKTQRKLSRESTPDNSAGELLPEATTLGDTGTSAEKI